MSFTVGVVMFPTRAVRVMVGDHRFDLSPEEAQSVADEIASAAKRAGAGEPEKVAPPEPVVTVVVDRAPTIKRLLEQAHAPRTPDPKPTESEKPKVWSGWSRRELALLALKHTGAAQSHIIAKHLHDVGLHNAHTLAQGGLQAALRAREVERYVVDGLNYYRLSRTGASLATKMDWHAPRRARGTPSLTTRARHTGPSSSARLHPAACRRRR